MAQSPDLGSIQYELIRRECETRRTAKGDTVLKAMKVNGGAFCAVLARDVGTKAREIPYSRRTYDNVSLSPASAGRRGMTVSQSDIITPNIMRPGIFGFILTYVIPRYFRITVMFTVGWLLYV
ncbi:unnamed protein product [Timema podura]|uniref:Uncharacterized protein n=1 Tax=Timema podura TaxID=61482 RepID=A0ABN7NRI9_TIMPD|nr:unnamed protein product [Timema podura]